VIFVASTITARDRVTDAVRLTRLEKDRVTRVGDDALAAGVMFEKHPA
jgi:hypothetical protein